MRRQRFRFHGRIDPARVVILCLWAFEAGGCRRETEPREVPSSTTNPTPSNVIPSATATASAAPAPPLQRELRRMHYFPAGDWSLGVANKDLAPSDGTIARRVHLDGFDLDELEVTVEDFSHCVREGACSVEGLSVRPDCNWDREDKKNHPMNCVRFFQAVAYCKWEGKRLPTEDEWEAAAVYSKLPLIVIEAKSACFRGETMVGGKEWGTCPVGASLGGGSTGLADLHGNVGEWTSGHFCNFQGAYCAEAVVRGTAWRGHLYEGYQNRWLGFRDGSKEYSVIPEHVRRLPEQVGIRCAKNHE